MSEPACASAPGLATPTPSASGLYDQSRLSVGRTKNKNGWSVIDIKIDWKRIFTFEK